MTNKTLLLASLLLFASSSLLAQATKRLSNTTLMHEMRATPSPLPGAVVVEKEVIFMWPLAGDNAAQGNALDGFESEHPKLDPTKANYKIRYSKDSRMKKEVVEASSSWAFFNPEGDLLPGTWHWQYGYCSAQGTHWSELLSFEVKANKQKFLPPSFASLMEQLPSTHPRILTTSNEWQQLRSSSASAEERGWYLERAEQVLKRKFVPIDEAIDTSKVAGLTNQVKRKALLTRESRRIVDREEANTEVLIRAYMLTQERHYFEAAMARITGMISWRNTPYFVGDFNQATSLSLASLAYDSFFQLLSPQQKAMLLGEIKENGTKIFNGFANHLENHIADNHNWQMNLRIFTFAAFAAYGDLPEAERWCDYAYNIWLARFPGLNQDGAWHNGDSYFHVNIKTLIELPYFFGKLSGFDFFADPWYEGSAQYVMFAQPPFSKSSGNGSAHLRVVKPSGTRLAYADALAKLTGNSYLADYVRVISAAGPKLMRKGFMAKPGDLSWFRLQCHIPLPEGEGMASLPLSHIFPQSGFASFLSSWKNIKRNSLFTFRSSPYGSTSHALANQNAFNTFYAGKPLFYSSGHHISFTDEHSVYCHRGTRAHNTILVDGMGQRIGTEGYGWMPRYYSGEKIGYVLGDASNAYGKVVSPLWKERGRLSGLDYSPENGWDENRLKTFRRHVVQLGGADLVFIYDELEADTEVSWSYLLHTVANPMEVQQEGKLIRIKATNVNGASDAFLFAPHQLSVAQTDTFFYPAVNWLRADSKGHFAPYANHWHFTAKSPKSKTYRLATIISTHHAKDSAIVPKQVSDDQIAVGDWLITLQLSTQRKASFSVENKKENISLIYDDTTVVNEKGKTTVLEDQLPELEL